MSRTARIVVSEYPHHIVQRGNNRQTIFYDDHDRKLYLDLLKRYSSECNCKIHAYCLMDNHVHILLVPKYEYCLAKAMQKLSLRYTQHVNKKYKRTGRLWECRFHSAVVDRDSYLWSVCKYIERNPVRARIVSQPNQYLWSSACDNILNRQNNFVELVWQNSAEREEYVNFLNAVDDKNEIDMIKKFTYTDKPIGTKVFCDHVCEILGVSINTRSKGRPRKP